MGREGPGSRLNPRGPGASPAPPRYRPRLGAKPDAATSVFPGTAWHRLGGGSGGSGDPAGLGEQRGEGTHASVSPLGQPVLLGSGRCRSPGSVCPGAVLGMSAPRSSLALHRHPLSMPRRLKFSEEEKFLILEEVSLRKDILIPRSGRYKNTPARQRAWEEIAAAVSSLSPLVHRTPDEIRRKWDNMVIDARRELAMQKHPVLRQRPQKQLSHNILALFDKPGPGLPEPPLSASTFGARAASDPSSPPTMLEVTPDLLLHGQSSTAAPGRGLLCPMEPSPASGPMLESCLSAASKAPNSKERLLPTGPQDITEKSLPPPSTAPSAPCPPAAVVLPAAAPPLSSSQDRGAAGMVPVLPASSPEPPRVKCPPSPVLAWPLLSATASPAIQSGGTGSSPAPEINGRVPEGSQPYPRGCVCVAGERLEKQSRLQTEVLELQKEILQLQKEKIMMEKEKLLLEIVKLRRELGT